ncbi:MAG: MFS transporter, partial [Caldilineaceae bacterium]|nr:MFS transporter [Caldilineaceae bacterium]
MNLPLSSFSRFRPDVKRLLIVSGLMAISFFGIQALLKVLYVLRLGHGPEYVGLFNASGALTWMIMSLPAGAVGDRIGLLRAMRLGGLLTVLGMVILPFTESVPLGWQTAWPILSQVVATSGWAFFGINLVPSLMSASTDANRNDVYALNAVLRGVGTLFGTVFGGVLPDIFAAVLGQSVEDPGPYRLGLWISVLLCLGAFVFLLRMRPVEQTESSAAEDVYGPFPAWPVGLLALHIFLINAGWATCQSFCNPYLDTDLHLSPAVIGLITGIGQAGAVFAPLLVPKLAGRWGNGWIMMTTGFASLLLLLPLGLSPHWSGAGFGRAGILAVTALWMPAMQIYQMESMEQHWRSLAYGLSSMAMGLSFGAVSIL